MSWQTEDNSWAYDIETQMNLFAVSFLNIATDEYRSFISVFATQGQEELMSKIHIPEEENFSSFLPFLKGLAYPTFVGYNSAAFDSPVLESAIEILKNTNRLTPSNTIRLYNLAMSQMSKDTKFVKAPVRRTYWRDLDVFRSNNLLRFRTSLKHCGIRLRHPSLQELDWESYKGVFPLEHFDKLQEYRKNDVVITKKVYIHYHHSTLMRRTVSNKYGLDLMNLDDAAMGSRILKSEIEKIATPEEHEMLKRKTYRNEVKLRDILLPQTNWHGMRNIEGFVDNAVRWGMDGKQEPFVPITIVGEKAYQLGAGGLHAIHDNLFIAASDDYILEDSDVRSYYPNLMILHRFIPEHLSDLVIRILQIMMDLRLSYKDDAKRLKNALLAALADALKITINSVPGRLNQEFSFLFDRKAFLSVTGNGQMLLLMLIRELVKAGVNVVSANTDGVLLHYHKSLKPTVDNIRAEWMDMSQMILETNAVSKQWMLNVNNYLSLKPDGSTSTKGFFSENELLHKGESFAVIRKAVTNQLLTGQSAAQYIKSCTDVLDFCETKRLMKNGSWLSGWDEMLGNYDLTQLTGKTIRYYNSTDGGILHKQSTVKDKLVGQADLFGGIAAETKLRANKSKYAVTTLTDVSEDLYDNINIDSYIEKMQKVVTKLTYQPSLFS